MRLLLYCPLPWVDPKFGASRVAIDLQTGLIDNGFHCDFFPAADNTIDRHEYASVLREHLRAHADNYDVVDFPFHAEPWQDTELAPQTLKVARVVLLPHHLDDHPMPTPPLTFFGKLKKVARQLPGLRRPPLYSPEIRRKMDQVMTEADLINVGNSHDKECLVRKGFSAEKILVLPYGLTRSGARQLEAVANRERSGPPVVAFVGTFDHRKGCLDFPELVQRVSDSVPGVRFRLLGTKGMFQTTESVLEHFPRDLRTRLEVRPTFEPGELPALLSDCHAGVFPSYWEGFGIAVVEMLAAGLPVVAYDAPGPCDILPPEWLVKPGDVAAMAGQVIVWLQEGPSAETRQYAVAQSRRFNWSDIARETLDIYRARLEQHRARLARPGH